jgi:hypothetical protein
MKSLVLPKWAAAIIPIGLLAIRPSVSAGLPVLSLNNPGSTTLHEISVAPGQAFGVDVVLNTDRALFCVQGHINASVSGVFDVTQNAPASPWLVADAGTGGLDPQSTQAGWVLPYPDYYGPGLTTLGNLQVLVDSAAATGTYSLNVVDIAVSGERWAPAYMGGIAGPSFIVHVAPESSSAGVISILALALSRRRP